MPFTLSKGLRVRETEYPIEANHWADAASIQPRQYYVIE